MPLEPAADLHWTAFLYVGGDLDPAEAAAFEARLADDQATREAVALAVELAEALAIVAPEFRPALPRRRPTRRVLVAMSSLAAAACVALVVVPQLLTIREDRPDASDVAIAWSSLRADAESLAVPPGSPATAPAPTAEADLEVDPEPSTDRALPSWLLAAASAPADAEPGPED